MIAVAINNTASFLLANPYIYARFPNPSPPTAPAIAEYPIKLIIVKVTPETKEGIVIESECIGKVYAEDEFDKNEWTVVGEPETTFVVTRPNTVELTCATIVNRIPDVLTAPAGYVPTSRMGEMKYQKMAK